MTSALLEISQNDLPWYFNPDLCGVVPSSHKVLAPKTQSIFRPIKLVCQKKKWLTGETPKEYKILHLLASTFFARPQTKIVMKLQSFLNKISIQAHGTPAAVFTRQFESLTVYLKDI